MRDADAFFAELDEEARKAFMWAGPTFTGVLLAWSTFDGMLAPDRWRDFLLLRVGGALVAAVLIGLSYARVVRHHRLLLIAWVLSLSATIAAMLPMVSTEVFPYYTMGYSLCAVGISTFATMRPAHVAAGLVVYLSLYAPSIGMLGFTSTEVVGSIYFLVTLCVAAQLQAMHRYRAAVAAWGQRQELAVARDDALAADQAKSSFLARMSHELRTPLNAIIGYAELVGEDLDDVEQQQDLGRIEGAGKHLLALINDILDLSKVAAGELEVRDEAVDLATCLEELRPLAEKLAEHRGNTLRWDVRDVHARADPLRVRQVVLNLVANAAKFTEGGTVAVRADGRGDHTVVSVADDGIGMDEEQLERAFLPFVQVHDDVATHGGTGLGLALSQQLAVRMGGRLEADSLQGHGSCFRLVLRAA